MEANFTKHKISKINFKKLRGWCMELEVQELYYIFCVFIYLKYIIICNILRALSRIYLYSTKIITTYLIH
ncbi:hypothetical protein DMI70_20675 [Escherichia coli]|nr:hypothetical protein [Escherichia coli]